MSSFYVKAASLSVLLQDKYMYTVNTEVDPVDVHATCFTTIQFLIRLKYFSIAKSTWFLSVLSILSVSYALAVHFTPCQNQYTTKWVKLESIHNNPSLIHRNLTSLHEHRYIVKKTVLRILENDQLHQTEKSNDIRAQNKKQVACKIITWVTDKRITIHSVRISICAPKLKMYHRHSCWGGWKTPQQKKEAVSL